MDECHVLKDSEIGGGPPEECRRDPEQESSCERDFRGMCRSEATSKGEGRNPKFVVDADELSVKVGQKNVAMSDLGPEIDAFVVVILEGIDAARLRDGEGFSRTGGWIVNEFSTAD